LFAGIAYALPTVPQRIISAMPSITEMLYALDLGDQIVGVTSNCNYPPQVEKKAKVGGFFLNLEKVVSLKPDLIVMLKGAQDQDIKKFKRFGLTVYPINPDSVKGVMDSLIELGGVTGKQARARKVVQVMQKRLGKIKIDFKSILKRKKVIVIVGHKPLIVAGAGTFIDGILIYAGVDNIGAQVKGEYPQYSLEKLVNENPDCLIIPQGMIELAKIKSDKRWRDIEAVKNNKILFIDPDTLSRPGPRVVDVVEEIAAFVHDK